MNGLGRREGRQSAGPNTTRASRERHRLASISLSPCTGARDGVAQWGGHPRAPPQKQRASPLRTHVPWTDRPSGAAGGATCRRARTQRRAPPRRRCWEGVGRAVEGVRWWTGGARRPALLPSRADAPPPHAVRCLSSSRFSPHRSPKSSKPRPPMGGRVGAFLPRRPARAALAARPAGRARASQGCIEAEKKKGAAPFAKKGRRPRVMGRWDGGRRRESEDWGASAAGPRYAEEGPWAARAAAEKDE